MVLFGSAHVSEVFGAGNPAGNVWLMMVLYATLAGINSTKPFC
jgi:hypothetical protein